MPDPPYDPGDTIRLENTLTDYVSGSPVVPSMISVHVANPSGVVATYPAPIAIASGQYRLDLVVTLPGVWSYNWVATGPNSVEGDRISVASSVV